MLQRFFCVNFCVPLFKICRCLELHKDRRWRDIELPVTCNLTQKFHKNHPLLPTSKSTFSPALTIRRIWRNRLHRRCLLDCQGTAIEAEMLCLLEVTACSCPSFWFWLADSCALASEAPIVQSIQISSWLVPSSCSLRMTPELPWNALFFVLRLDKWLKTGKEGGKKVLWVAPKWEGSLNDLRFSHGTSWTLKQGQPFPIRIWESRLEP